MQAEDKETALDTFNDMLFKHLGYTFNRTARAFAYGYVGGSSDAPKSVDDFTRPYYKMINRLSTNFALTADMCLGLLAGDIKRKEMLSGRLADIHANLFISTAILKYYEHGKKTEAEQVHAKLALEKSLFNTQEAFYGLFANFPVGIAASLVKFICFPLGRPVNKPSDALKQQAGEIIMQDNAFRDELKKHVFYNTAEDDVTGRMESTFNLLLELEPLWDKFKKAESKGQFKGLTFDERIRDAVETGFITQQEASSLLTYNAKRYDSMLTDVFDSELDQALELENPYNDEEESAPMPDTEQQEPLAP